MSETLNPVMSNQTLEVQQKKPTEFEKNCITDVQKSPENENLPDAGAEQEFVDEEGLKISCLLQMSTLLASITSALIIDNE